MNELQTSPFVSVMDFFAKTTNDEDNFQALRSSSQSSFPSLQKKTLELLWRNAGCDFSGVASLDSSSKGARVKIRVRGGIRLFLNHDE